MAKVTALHGSSPSGWSRDRWVWLKAVTADGRLLPMARLLANVLAQGFSNHETGECNPGVAALMKALGASRRTVFRALAELEESGWLSRLGGEAPGKTATYCFRYPERVPDMTPERVPPVTPTGAMEAAPPIPPYKDKPNMNQRTGLLRAASQVVVKGGQRPPGQTVCVPAGSVRAGLWDDWLTANGYPPLEAIGLRLDQSGKDGWEMPATVPASFEDEVPFRIAVRWADWLRKRA